MKDIFCKIADGNSSANKIIEDENTIAFLDKEPETKGHILVIPKSHYEDITELPSVVSEEIIKNISRAKEALEKLFDYSSFKIFTVLGKAQEVNHIHWHLVGEDDSENEEEFYFQKFNNEKELQKDLRETRKEIVEELN